MIKRAFTVFSVLLFAMAGLSVRIISLSENEVQAGKTVSAKSIDLATLRGTVYDCNLNPITNAETDIYIAAKPSNEAVAVLKGVLNPDVFESIKERLAKGKPVAVKSEKSVDDSENIKTVYVPKRYGDDGFACHIIGYLGADGTGVSGVEKIFDSILSREIKTAKIRFSADANGRAMLGEAISVEDNEMPKNGIVLTIDKDIQKITEFALDKFGAECAAAVVMEIKSGAVRACVSRPAFDRNSLPDALYDENSPLINRALLAFSAGSVFKPVVAAAALENGIAEDFEYNCTGNVTYNGVTFNCHKRSGHGVLDMEGALANSCNTYFIALANETGAESIIDTAQNFGFGKQITLAEGMRSAQGYLPSKSEIDSKASLANLSFGQGQLLATPLHICSMTATIANNGIRVNPYLVEGETDSYGNFIRIKHYKEKIQVISENTAQLLRIFLQSVVTNGSGRNAESEYVSTAGKTATAQTGRTENGNEIYNSWFAGYFPADNPEYAVVIMREKGEGGSIDCAPIFRVIAETVYLTG